LKSSPDVPTTVVGVYDQDFNLLAMRANKNGEFEQIEIDVCLPNQIVLQIRPGRDPSELSQMTLAGIRLEKKLLEKVVTLHMGEVDQPDLKKISILPAEKKLLWNQTGYVIINLFHHDPFAWHLLIGNRIKF